jgi:signal transduction histidine kinase
MTDTARIDQAETIPMPNDLTGPQPPAAQSAAQPPVAQPPGTTPPSRFYREAWRHLPRNLGYMIVTAFLLFTLYLIFPTIVLHTGLSAASTPFGIFVFLINPFGAALFVVGLICARWLGAFEKLRIGAAEPQPIRPVDWTPRWRQNWFMRTISAVANPHYWLYLLHAVVVYPVVALVTVGAGGFLLAGFFGPIAAGVSALANGWQINDALARMNFDQDWAWVLGGFACAIVMTISVLLFPVWLRAAVLAHYWVDVALLGGFRAEVLERRVEGLRDSRAGAVAAEGLALRQIERDLHDGPQQRLVRLRMDLASAERAMAKDPEAAKQLIAEASEHAKDALDELRALSRGFAPPILLDRGLVAALEALASRTPLPVGLQIALPDWLVLPTEVERNVYFTVSELLTNTTKHAGATSAGVYLGLIEDAAGQPVLSVGVTDDGRGGASLRAGHGLEGLVGRMRALDGELTISSPDGGPTEATARIPLGALHGVPVGERP